MNNFIIFIAQNTVKVTLLYYKINQKMNFDLFFRLLHYNNLENKADPQQVVTECHSHAYRTLVHKTSSTFG